jgi:protein-S-isoprenylcysteine O-methyltransferase Ste14
MVIYGAILLRKIGKLDTARSDPTLIGIEKTAELVTVGAYRYIRHPIYSSFVYGAWGVFFKRPAFTSGCLAVITIIFITITAKMEETENIQYFGDAYREYMKRTKMFIPFFF